MKEEKELEEKGVAIKDVEYSSYLSESDKLHFNHPTLNPKDKGELKPVEKIKEKEPNGSTSYSLEYTTSLLKNTYLHLAPADSIAVALPTVEHAPSAEETESFETDKSAATPPPHPAYRIPLPPLPVSPPPHASPTYLLGYRDAMIWLRAKAPSTSYSLPLPPPIILSRTRSDAPPSGTPPILPIPLPTSSPSLLLPSTDHGADRPEVCLPPWKRLCFAFGPRYEVRESSSAPATKPTRDFRVDYGFIATLDREIRRDLEREVGYGIIDTWDEMLEDMPGAPATDEIKLGQRMTNFRDRSAHAHTALLIKREAILSREAWGRSMIASDLTRSEVMTLRTHVVAQQLEIAALRAGDHARQAQLTETLRLMSILQT
ncbi:hypothetical protein Tco_1555566 [Tanacetum coccineum]